jgi:hypothetical protein
VSGNENHDSDPSAQQEAPSTNPQDEVFGAMTPPPNVAEFLSPEQMKAFDQVSPGYGDASDSAALSGSEPALYDMGMAPPQQQAAPPVGMVGGEPFSHQQAPQQPQFQQGGPHLAGSESAVGDPLGQPVVVPHRQLGSEGMPGGDARGTPLAPPPEPVDHDPGSEAPFRTTPPRTAFRDTVQDDPTGVTERGSTTPPGSETLDLISANHPLEAVPHWPDFQPVPPPQPAAPAPTDPTHVDQSASAPQETPPLGAAIGELILGWFLTIGSAKHYHEYKARFWARYLRILSRSR